MDKKLLTSMLLICQNLIESETLTFEYSLILNTERTDKFYIGLLNLHNEVFFFNYKDEGLTPNSSHLLSIIHHNKILRKFETYGYVLKFEGKPESNAFTAYNLTENSHDLHVVDSLVDKGVVITNVAIPKSIKSITHVNILNQTIDSGRLTRAKLNTNETHRAAVLKLPINLCSIAMLQSDNLITKEWDDVVACYNKLQTLIVLLKENKIQCLTIQRKNPDLAEYTVLESTSDTVYTVEKMISDNEPKVITYLVTAKNNDNPAQAIGFTITEGEDCKYLLPDNTLYQFQTIEATNRMKLVSLI